MLITAPCPRSYARPAALVPRSAPPPPVTGCLLLNGPDSPQQCAEWFRDQRYTSCLRCPVPGAQGPKGPSCIRCSKTGTRLVAARCYCPSCFNRTREVIAGRNAKGGAPVRTQAVVIPFCCIVEAPAESIRATVAKHSGLIEVTRYTPTTAWIVGFASGRDEVERLVERVFPDGKLVDFDIQQWAPGTK